MAGPLRSVVTRRMALWRVVGVAAGVATTACEVIEIVSRFPIGEGTLKPTVLEFL